MLLAGIDELSEVSALLQPHLDEADTCLADLALSVPQAQVNALTTACPTGMAMLHMHAPVLS